MRLVSNFTDFYDPFFSLTGPIFRRMGTEGLSKPDQFKLMEAASFSTPPHGKVEDIVDRYWPEEDRHVKLVVVYDDPMLHCGYGKRLIGPAQYKWDGNISKILEVQKTKKKYASAYVCGHAPQIPSCSWRLLHVGRHRFWLEYKGTEGWMSNCGDGTCEVIAKEINFGYHPHIKLPLWAVDFAIGKEMYAVDFNTAPGINKSGVEKILTGRETVRAIEDAYRDLQLET